MDVKVSYEEIMDFNYEKYLGEHHEIKYILNRLGL